MKKVSIDLRGATGKEQIHREIAAALQFPEYYGGNLDALYDCLTEIDEDVCVGIYAPGGDDMTEYLQRMQRVFADAEGENAHLCAFFFLPEEDTDEYDWI